MVEESKPKEVKFYLHPEEKRKLKALVASYQLSMQQVLRECVLNMIKEEDRKYHDLMIDLFESPYIDPESTHWFDEEIESIYAQLEEETED